MKRTLNEIYRLCQKAVEGAGAPAGMDIDAGHNTAWLLARELPVLAGLFTTLERLEQSEGIDACRFDLGVAMSPSAEFDAAGKAGALIAPALVELLVAHSENRQSQISTTNLSTPLYLLPAAARYANGNHSFYFELISPHDEYFVMIVDNDGVNIRGPAGADIGTDICGMTGDAGFDVVAYCASNQHTWPTPTAELVLLVSNDSLVATAARSLAEGVEIHEPEAWRKLQIFAAKVLVPATEASRQHGAGAGLRDNE